MRRIALKAMVMLAGVLLLGGGTHAGDSRTLTVVELFTSQGCSSCPPADALLGALAAEPGILALSMPVDYWDYLGWKDTLASPAFSARQKAYAQMRGDRAVYTPQAVIGGEAHVVGSKERDMRRAIDRASSDAGLAPEVSLEVAAEADALGVRVGAGPRSSDEATVWVLTYDPEVRVRIRKGENKGRSIVYHNVVRRMDAVARWNGEPLSLRVDMRAEKGRRCAVLLQAGDAAAPGRILAAATPGGEATR